MEYFVRVISSANENAHPNNTANQFTNDLKPPIINIQSIGVVEITFSLKYDEKLEDQNFLNDNQFFFINSDIIEGQRIANQNINSMNEFQLPIQTIVNSDVKEKRIVQKFKDDFMYLNLNSIKEIENISFLITNLIGEPHPLISGSTTVILKYTEMDNNTNTIVRIVSSANRADNPNNNALFFKNFLQPPVLNVDSVGLSKITIPLLRDEPEPYKGKFTNKKYREGIENFNFGESTVQVATFKIYYQSTEKSPVSLRTIYLFMGKTNNPVLREDTPRTNDNISDVLYTYFDFKLLSEKDYDDNKDTFNIYLDPSVKDTNIFDFIILPGSNLEVFKIKDIAISFTSSEYILNNCRIRLFPPKNIVFTDDNQIMIRDIFEFVYMYDKTDKSFWETENWNPWGVKDDIILVTSDNIDAISYGNKMYPILNIIPLNEKNFSDGTISLTIPDTNFYLCRTNTNVLDSFTIKLLNQDLEEHKLIDKSRTTIVSLVVSYGTNSEV